MGSPLKDLAEMSRLVAEHPRFVQGGGGNCSIKSHGRISIKASGFFLEDVTETDGFAILELPGGNPILGQSLRPSLELGMHLLLGDYVIHTHPICVGALVCAQEGKGFYHKRFSAGHIWVEYASPGPHLSDTLARRLSSEGWARSMDTVFFLENHGLVVSSPDKDRCLRLHRRVIEDLELFFGATTPQKTPAENHYLTPDHAVYSRLAGEALSGKQRLAFNEVNIFARSVLGMISAKGWQARYLPAAEAASLVSMEAEKYRQDLWRKNP